MILKTESNMIRGHAVITEARKLISEMQYSPNRGDFREKKHLSILVDPRYDPSTRLMRVLVTCHPFGHLTVDWEGYVVVTVQPGQEPLDSAFAFLDKRGQAIFDSLPSGNYTLSLEPYDESLWLRCTVVPVDQLARQQWISLPSAEKVCELLVSGAAEATGLLSDRTKRIQTLTTIAHQADKFARPALKSCLNLMCDPSIPAELRLSAAQGISKSAVDLAGELDLAPFSKALASTEKTEKRDIRLEKNMCAGFGIILAARKQTLEDEIQLLTAFVTRNAASGFDFFRTPAVRTKGRIPSGTRGMGVRTRGTITGDQPLNPLLDLARAGGRRVRDELIRLLKQKPGNKRLIGQLLAIV